MYNKDSLHHPSPPHITPPPLPLQDPERTVAGALLAARRWRGRGGTAAQPLRTRRGRGGAPRGCCSSWRRTGAPGRAPSRGSPERGGTGCFIIKFKMLLGDSDYPNIFLKKSLDFLRLDFEVEPYYFRSNPPGNDKPNFLKNSVSKLVMTIGNVTPFNRFVFFRWKRLPLFGDWRGSENVPKMIQKRSRKCPPKDPHIFRKSRFFSFFFGKNDKSVIFVEKVGILKFQMMICLLQ